MCKIVKHKGTLYKIKVVKEDNEICVIVYLKYTNGILSTIINGETLKEIIDKYDIGIPYDTTFVLTDYDKMFYIESRIYDESCKAILLDVISGFDESIKNYIKILLKDVYFDENGNWLTLEEVASIDTEVAPINEFTEVSSNEDLFFDSSYFMEFLNKKAIVCFTDCLILTYSNDWYYDFDYMEDKSYGGATFIKNNEIVDTTQLYDFSYTNLINDIVYIFIIHDIRVFVNYDNTKNYIFLL